MKPIDNLKITIVQSDIVWQNIDANLINFGKKIDNVTELTDIIVLPEMFATGFSMKPGLYAQPETGEIYKWLAEKAKQKKAVIVASVITEDNGKYYNRLVWMQEDGTFQTYNKRHLFTFAGEHEKYSPGENQLIVNFKGWRIKLLICYDLRFPVWSRNNKDYDLLIYVANWPERRSYPWKTLLLARAIENLSYVAGVNRVGDDGNNISHSGDSALIDYKGEILSKIKPFEEYVETISISYPELIEFRSKFPAENDADKFNIIL